MLWLTGLLFATNAVHAAARKAWIYAAALAALAITSYLWHARTTDSQLLFWLDQLALWCVVLLGAYYWQRMTGNDRWIPAILVIAVISMGYGGALTESFVYDSDESINRPAHGIVHVLSSIGHHAILSTI